jgi:hypothetical protein
MERKGRYVSPRICSFRKADQMTPRHAMPRPLSLSNEVLAMIECEALHCDTVLMWRIAIPNHSLNRVRPTHIRATAGAGRSAPPRVEWRADQGYAAVCLRSSSVGFMQRLQSEGRIALVPAACHGGRNASVTESEGRGRPGGEWAPGGGGRGPEDDSEDDGGESRDDAEEGDGHIGLGACREVHVLERVILEVVSPDPLHAHRAA